MASATARPVTRDYTYYRHTLPVRIMHWINVVALTILLMSGLQIFNAYPALYWGKSSYAGRAPLLELRAADRGDLGAKGVTRVLGREYDTTGVLGLSKNTDGRLAARGFPWWATIPDNKSLALGAIVALLLRVGVAGERPLLCRVFGRDTASLARSRAGRATTGARSAARSSITCVSGIRRARRRSATTCCRSSRISP